MTVPVYVLNLERDRGRRDYMQATLAAVGISAQFAPGVDGRALSQADLAMVDRKRCLHVYGSEMRPGEIGCYLGHYRLYQRLLAEGVKIALILEDDVRIDPALPKLLDEVEAMQGVDWSIIHLRSGRGRVLKAEGAAARGHCLARFSTGHELHLLRTHILSGGAYFISEQGLRRMVEFGRRIFMPIDHTMDRYWENGILPMVIRPLPILHNNDFESSIGSHGREAHETYPLLDRLAHRWRRGYDSLPKRWFWIWRRIVGKPC